MERGGARRGTFGARLRRLREAAGLTQEELASKAGLTANGIGMLERGQRTHPYPHTVRSLADAMKLSDHERTDLLAAVPGRDAGAEPAPTLPVPPTPLVGRECEVGEIAELLGRPEVRFLAQVALAEGDLEDATRLFEEGLTVSVELGEDSSEAFYLQGIAAVAARRGDPSRAARLWGAAEALLEGIEVISYAHTPDRSVYERQVDEARKQFDEATWRRAWVGGRAMSKKAAVEEALRSGE